VKRVSALVVSGYLGSGKTTLVRHLLAAAQARGERVAVISNEFGALGLDAAMLADANDGMVELSGGCVCCALNDDLYNTILSLREKIDPDRIIVETSGVAIPSDVQITFWQPPIRDWLADEAIVTVVNAEQLDQQRDLDQTFTEQVETADLALLNKVDLVADSDPLAARLAAMNPGMPVVRAIQGVVDSDLLLSPLNDRAAPPERHDHDHHHHHHEAFESFELSVAPNTTAEALLAQVAGQGALRAKGFVWVDGSPHLLQGVGRRIELAPTDIAAPAELFNRIVIIRRAAPAGHAPRSSP
jgi:cobalamin biosynthesis protein CobW